MNKYILLIYTTKNCLHKLTSPTQFDAILPPADRTSNSGKLVFESIVFKASRVQKLQACTDSLEFSVVLCDMDVYS